MSKKLLDGIKSPTDLVNKTWLRAPVRSPVPGWGSLIIVAAYGSNAAVSFEYAGLLNRRPWLAKSLQDR